MPTEEEFARTPDALGGRAMLEAGLDRIAPAEREAFYEAVRRCYASALEDGDAPDAKAALERTI